MLMKASLLQESIEHLTRQENTIRTNIADTKAEILQQARKQTLNPPGRPETGRLSLRLSLHRLLPGP